MMNNRQRARILGAALIAPALGIALLTSATPAMAATSVGSSAAKATALHRTGGGHLHKIYKETEHGRHVWCAEIRKGNRVYDVDVSRDSGRVVEVEREVED